MAEAGDSFTNLIPTNTAELLTMFEGDSFTDMFQGLSEKGGTMRCVNRVNLVSAIYVPA